MMTDNNLARIGSACIHGIRVGLGQVARSLRMGSAPIDHAVAAANVVAFYVVVQVTGFRNLQLVPSLPLRTKLILLVVTVVAYWGALTTVRNLRIDSAERLATRRGTTRGVG
jgi:hypothetical protein